MDRGMSRCLPVTAPGPSPSSRFPSRGASPRRAGRAPPLNRRRVPGSRSRFPVPEFPVPSSRFPPPGAPGKKSKKTSDCFPKRGSEMSIYLGRARGAFRGEYFVSLL